MKTKELKYASAIGFSLLVFGSATYAAPEQLLDQEQIQLREREQE